MFFSAFDATASIVIDNEYEVRMYLPKNLGMYLVSVWFILAGLASFVSYGSLGMLLPVLMIVIGGVLLIELMSHRSAHSTETEEMLERQWSQLRGPIMAWWNKLTDRDLDEIDGSYPVLVAKLRTKYGMTAQMAREDIDGRLYEFQRNDRAVARA